MSTDKAQKRLRINAVFTLVFFLITGFFAVMNVFDEKSYAVASAVSFGCAETCAAEEAGCFPVRLTHPLTGAE
jgi:hypothetical protein